MQISDRHKDMLGPDGELLPGVRWGQPEEIFSPAFWWDLANQRRADQGIRNFSLGATLQEEVAACMLGGHGIPAEVGLEAFHTLRLQGLLTGAPTADELDQALAVPLRVNGKAVNYRFRKQKARYLSGALQQLELERPPVESCTTFRNWLLRIPGIGPKTASWVTRNWLHSNCVAIIDIHIFRAGVLAGIFAPYESIESDYWSLEARFLDFAASLGVEAALLDALIWHHMREARGWPVRLVESRIAAEDQLVAKGLSKSLRRGPFKEDCKCQAAEAVDTVRVRQVAVEASSAPVAAFQAPILAPA